MRFGCTAGGAAAEGGQSVFSSAHLQFKLLLSLANSPIYQFNQCFFKCVPRPRHARHWFQAVVDKMRRSSGRHCQRGTTPNPFPPTRSPHLTGHSCERPAWRPQHNYLIKKGWTRWESEWGAATIAGWWNVERVGSRLNYWNAKWKHVHAIRRRRRRRQRWSTKGIHTETPRKWQTRAAAQAARENRPSRKSMTEISEEIPATEKKYA